MWDWRGRRREGPGRRTRPLLDWPDNEAIPFAHGVVGLRGHAYMDGKRGALGGNLIDFLLAPEMAAVLA